MKTSNCGLTAGSEQVQDMSGRGSMFIHGPDNAGYRSERVVSFCMLKSGATEKSFTAPVYPSSAWQYSDPRY